MVRSTLYMMLGGMCVAAQCTAWGPAGHQVVARIAAQHLTNNARQGVAELLGLQSTFMNRLSEALSQISDDADEFRNAHPETGRWHYVNIPLDATSYDPQRDCPALRDGDCIIQAIERERVKLRDASKTKEERRQALMFVVHLLGDLHQPLHCADNGDRGGNNTRVLFLGRESNLHSVWDSGLIETTGMTAVEYAESLLDDLNAPVGLIQAGNPVNWALESQTVARTNAYKFVRDGKLDRNYAKKNMPVVGQQLFRGGVRLAKVLNEAFE